MKPAIWLLLPFLLVITACSTRPQAIETPITSAQTNSTQIFIVRHRWHTGFVVPAEDVFGRIPELRGRFPNAAYLEFGWGDGNFYPSATFSMGLALRALLWPTDTAVHVAAVPEDVTQYFNLIPIRVICLDKTQLEGLLQFLANSLEYDSESSLQLMRRGLYGDSAFFVGTGSYHLFNTCNQWTAKGLRSAGMLITPASHFQADSILDYLDQQSSHRCRRSI